MKLINTSDLRPGMVVAQNVYTLDDQLVLARGTRLDVSAIRRLANYAILNVFIDDGKPSEPEVVLPPDASYAERLRVTPQFRQFRRDLEENVDTLRRTMRAIAGTDEPLKLNEFTEPVATLLGDAGNGMGALEMLQNLRDMSDAIYVHSLNVALIASVLGKWMKLREYELQVVTAAGLLHDIGKTGLQPDLLNKTGQLTPGEERAMRSHATKGYEMVKNLRIDPRIKNAVLMHHERRDGSGYPFRLQGEQIETVAGIIAVADTYEEMTSARKGMTPFDVIAMFERDGLMKYDTAAVMTFLDQIANTFVGNRVRLTNGVEGEIIYINPARLARPTLKCANGYYDLARDPKVHFAEMI
ncbi:MAG: HD domain-containing protein [Butyrivibrio sp.]|nr:HD domain-containing protein [Butyrivibrio sp.]